MAIGIAVTLIGRGNFDVMIQVHYFRYVSLGQVCNQRTVSHAFQCYEGIIRGIDFMCAALQVGRKSEFRNERPKYMAKLLENNGNKLENMLH